MLHQETTAPAGTVRYCLDPFSTVNGVIQDAGGPCEPKAGEYFGPYQTRFLSFVPNEMLALAVGAFLIMSGAFKFQARKSI
jgi:hypothetical protein